MKLKGLSLPLLLPKLLVTNHSVITSFFWYHEASFFGFHLLKKIFNGIFHHAKLYSFNSNFSKFVSFKFLVCFKVRHRKHNEN